MNEPDLRLLADSMADHLRAAADDDERDGCMDAFLTLAYQHGSDDAVARNAETMRTLENEVISLRMAVDYVLARVRDDEVFAHHMIGTQALYLLEKTRYGVALSNTPVPDSGGKE